MSCTSYLYDRRSIYRHVIVLLFNPLTQSLLLLLLLRNSSWFRRRSPLVGFLLSAVDLSALSFGTSHIRRDRCDPDINDRRTISAYSPPVTRYVGFGSRFSAYISLFHPLFVSLSLSPFLSLFLSSSLTLCGTYFESLKIAFLSSLHLYLSVFQSFSLSLYLALFVKQGLLKIPQVINWLTYIITSRSL